MKRAWKGANRFFLNLLLHLFPGLAKTPAKAETKHKKERMLSFVVFGLCAGALSLILFAKTKPGPQRDEIIHTQTQAQLSGSLPPLSPAKTKVVQVETSPYIQAPLLRTDLLEHLDSSEALEEEADPARDIFRPADVPEPVFPEKREAKKIQQEADPAIPIEPEIEVKLLGFLEKQIGPSQNELERYAILSMEGEIFVVKKGDIIGGRFEVIRISTEEAEILDKEKGDVLKLAIEKNS